VTTGQRRSGLQPYSRRSGVIAPAYDKSRVSAIMQKLEAAVQYTPATVTTTVAPPAPTGETK
jgi:hypothetical protein